MKAVILAAGKGTRFLPLTETTPKTLIEVSGKPIINWIFQNLPDEIDEVIIVVDHLKEKIISHIGKNFLGRKVFYANQREKRGTFGALLSAKEILKGSGRFLVLNGDDLNSKSELEKYLQYPRTLGLQKKVMPNYYRVLLDENNFVQGFTAQTDEEKVNGVSVVTGVYVIDENIFKEEGVIVSGGEYGLPQTILKQKNEFPIKAIFTSSWTPINSPEDIKSAEKIWRGVEESDSRQQFWRL